MFLFLCLSSFPSLVLCLVAQSCPIVCDPWTVAHQALPSMRILQARILEWVTMLSFRESSQNRDQTQISHIAGRFFTIWAPGEALWATREAHHVSFCQLGLLLSLASTFLGLSQSYFSQVRSKSQHMSGECVISLVLSCCNKNLKWRTSVTAWLQLRVLFSKQRIIHSWGMRVSQSKGKP